MKLLDQNTSTNFKVPQLVLMEQAAMCFVRELLSIMPQIKKAVVFCGKGNNGGDGFVIARHLHNKKCNVTVYLACGKNFSKDAHINFDIIKVSIYKSGCFLLA